MMVDGVSCDLMCTKEQMSGTESVVSSVRLYQQLLHVDLQHRPDLLDNLYYASIKVGHTLTRPACINMRLF